MDPKVLNHFDGDISRANIRPSKRASIIARYSGTPLNEYLDTVETATSLAESSNYECPGCGYSYDQSRGDVREGFAAGTPFKSIPESWVCPDCGVRERNEFRPLAVSDRPTNT